MTDPEHHGQAFGLCFRSNQPLPEMSPIASVEGPQAEVHIDWLPASPAAAPTGAGVSLHAEDSHFYLHMPEVARYQVGFDRITVALIGRADDRSVRAFLFGSAVGALLYRRGLTLLHGTTVELPDGSAAVF